MEAWTERLQQFDIVFCDPLDLDMSMLLAFADQYRELDEGMKGPGKDGNAAQAVLGKNGKPSLYNLDEWADEFSWYRYLFLGRGKPTTHLRVLSQIDDKTLAEGAPEELKVLLQHVAKVVGQSAGEET